MLFNFEKFLETLPQGFTSAFYKRFGRPNRLEDCNFYKSYVSKIPTLTLDYNVPEELVTDFDWGLLSQLAFSSFSCNAFLEETVSGSDLCISVVSDNRNVIKKVSELWSFQILNLYNIFIKEQMELQLIASSDIDDQIAIDRQRALRLDRTLLLLGLKTNESRTNFFNNNNPLGFPINLN